MSNFSKEFVYKHSEYTFHAAPDNAENLRKFIDACKELKLEKKMKVLLEKYAVKFGSVPPQFKNLSFAAPFVTKDIFEKLVERIENMKVEAGKPYFLASSDWFKNLNSEPEASDISKLEKELEDGHLFDPDPDFWEENFQLKNNLVENTDFVIMDEQLTEYFSDKNGGIFLKRYSYNPAGDELDENGVVEILLRRINVLVQDDRKTQNLHFFISNRRSLEDLNEKLPRILKFNFPNIRREFQVFKKTGGALLPLTDTLFGEEDVLVIEFADSRGKFKLSSTSTSQEERCETLHKPASTEPQPKSEPMDIETPSDSWLPELLSSATESVRQLKGMEVRCGKTGLQNLGNTCFMNSALQCLSNTFEFTNFFLRGQEKAAINKSNPLGTKGILVAAYAELMKSVWLGKSNSISPWDVKKIIGKHAHQFVGYGQQDSQEFLSYLLDLLHEDLNTVLKKPYIEAADYDGTKDIQDSLESWNNFKRRNDSIVVSLFYGQYKSTVVCAKCRFVSVTYDPYNVLSLPIGNPSVEESPVVVYIVQSDVNKPMLKVIRNCSGNEKAIETLEKVAKQRNLENPLFIEMESMIIKSVVSTTQTVNKVKKDKTNLLIFEMSSPREALVKISFCKEQTSYKDPELIMIPKIFWIFKSFTFNDAYNYVLSVLKIPFASYPQEKILDFFSIRLQHKRTINNLVSKRDFFPCFLCERDICQGCDLQRNDTAFSKVVPPNCNEINLLVSISREACKNVQNFLNIKEEVVHSAEPHKENTIYSCLSLFTEPEILDEANAWYCSRCKSLQQASVTLEIMRVPEILIVHLKRFKVSKKSYSFFGGGTQTTKINKEIHFPLKNLNLTSFVKASNGSEIYDLFAVSNHFGGMGGGHYTAYGKNFVDGKWYDFNDSHVSEIKENSVPGASAYLLFYRRKRL